MLPTGSSNQPQFTSKDENRHFSTDHLKDDLGGRSTRGGGVTAVAQAVKLVISTAAMVVVARLLTPQDYGLIGMVAILVNFIGMFQYLGLSTATIKWSKLNHQQVSTLFWINFVLSVAVSLLTAASGPLLVWFYQEPRLVWITIGYALSLLLTGLYIQHAAILIRQMRFVVIAIVEIASMAIGLAAAVVAAWFGAGYWALVLNQLVMALVTLVGMWVACGWRPGLPARRTGVRSMLSYGGHLTGYDLMTFLSRNLDNALIGRFGGAHQLGIYSRAYQMLLMPLSNLNTPLATVAVPALSRLADSPERYRAAYLKILQKIALITMPGIVFMVATSDWLVVFLLGAQWHDSARIFMLLGMAAIIQPVTGTCAWLFVTQGRVREKLKWGLMGGTVAITSIVIGLPWGATGVAASYGAADLFIATPLLFWYVGRRGPVLASDIYSTIALPACAAVCSLAVLIISRPWLKLLASPGIRLAFSLVISLAVSFLVLAAIPAGRVALRNFKEMLLLMLKRPRESVADIAV
jgi:PST family polysaccharide transporter